MPRTTTKKQAATPPPAAAPASTPPPTAPEKSNPGVEDVEDLLHSSLLDLPEQEKKRAAARLHSFICHELDEDQELCTLQNIARYIDIEEHDRGCTTPAEEFISRLVSTHYECEGLTPEVTVHELEDFTDSFQRLRRDMRRFQRMGGKLTGATDEAETQQGTKWPFQEAICQALLLNGVHHSLVIAAVDCIHNDKGLTTPAEQFICALLLMYGRHGTLTPGDIENDLERFRQDFEMDVNICRQFNKQYAAEI